MRVNHTIAQVLVGFFVLVLLIPLFRDNMFYLSSDGEGGSITQGISQTLWEDRLPELYLQPLFLGAAIIASLLVIRKPPKFAVDELEKYGLQEDSE